MVKLIILLCFVVLILHNMYVGCYMAQNSSYYKSSLV